MSSRSKRGPTRRRELPRLAPADQQDDPPPTKEQLREAEAARAADLQSIASQALTSCGEMRSKLASVEPSAVYLARRAGYSWARVGELLGITRQAAQQRYGAMMANTDKPRNGPIICHFSGQWESCAGVATHRRGTVPLCESCEERSSSLRRFPRVALPGAGMAG